MFRVGGAMPDAHLTLMVWPRRWRIGSAGFWAPFLLMNDQYPVYLVIRTNEGLVTGDVIKQQGLDDGRLKQKLIIVNSDRVDQEDVLEGLCWLLLNRYIIMKQPRGEDPESMPDWLSTGLAQHLYPRLRKRNHDAVTALLEESTPVAVEALVSLTYLPYGRWLNKIYLGVFAGWLLDAPDAVQRLGKWFRVLASGRPLTEEEIMRFLGASSMRVDPIGTPFVAGRVDPGAYRCFSRTFGFGC